LFPIQLSFPVDNSAAQCCHKRPKNGIAILSNQNKFKKPVVAPMIAFLATSLDFPLPIELSMPFHQAFVVHLCWPRRM
jgi:hypothetical protein